MSEKSTIGESFLFEVSWEVCNKVGGIHTVISTKALSMRKDFNDSHILIGPDIWKDKINPEFEEDQELYKSWKNRAKQEGLSVRVGRWNISGKPIVILIDFSPFFTKKDEILKDFWEKFQLDSLTGHWDYIEPFIFGYTAGRVIESFSKYNLSFRQPIIAQFHEWMTGSGLLYLRDCMPNIATVFTTHATVLGRSIAGNGMPLYSNMSNYNPYDYANKFQVRAKLCLERKSAEYADCFTTVSDITATECTQFLGKSVDLVTPNGFENSFTPNEDKWEEVRKSGRDVLTNVASTILEKDIDKDAIMLCIGGRYEYKNKGIDVFIDSLGDINRNNKSKKEIIAFVLVPGGYNSLNYELDNNLNNSNKLAIKNKYTTHNLIDEANDPVMRKIRELGLLNKKEDKVKIIFCPSYLNGSDGIFNKSYYDLLIAMDISVFPSYYEPWGYTPLESIAFKVPTITTTLAGFGLWVNTNYGKSHPGISVIERDDNKYDSVVSSISDSIIEISNLNKTAIKEIRENAKDISNIALWENLYSYYIKGYQMALKKVEARRGNITREDSNNVEYIGKQLKVNSPTIINVLVHRSLPKELMPLEELAKNLWWSWNDDAKNLFKSISPEKWDKLGQNPIALLDAISLDSYIKLKKDKSFISKMKSVYDNFQNYMSEKEKMQGPTISYFSMEYGLHNSLKIFSGGLGILAGDYLKEASDKGCRITGVGLLYKYGYFTQKFSSAGDQEAAYDTQDFSKIPASPVYNEDGEWAKIAIELPGRDVKARIWRVDVGRIELYLLDTDFEDNNPEDRSITHHLYGGDWENRLKQEILLGFGGIRALREIGVNTDIYHCNEGHAAFIGLERIREYINNDKLSFGEAIEVVRASSLFTTHTPVPAGHDAFNEDMLRRYIYKFTDSMKVSWEQIILLGKTNVTNPNEKFSMSFLAANLSQEINGVSKLHGEVSKGIFKNLWPGYLNDESPVTYVTNGVHYPTWTANEWKEIHKEAFGKEFETHHYNKDCFKGIYNVEDKKIVKVRKTLRTNLINEIKKRLTDGGDTAFFTPRQLVEIRDIIRDDILTIGFARRFATYKRAHLLFQDIEHLDRIVNNTEKPVQFIFAGKAHPADKAGQDLIKRIVEISKYPQFIGKIIFLPNYDMELARAMVQGVDVWMNTPTRPQEASGTSGEKAAMNGVMHFSVLDGWWAEGYREDSGWALPEKRTYENQYFQDEMDSQMIYNIIEDEIAPTFYSNKGKGEAKEWISYIKANIAEVASNFTTNRMLTDYENQYYIPMAKRANKLSSNNFKLAIEISDWKSKISREWDNISLDSIELPDRSKQVISLGGSYYGKVVLNIGSLKPEEVGVEVVSTYYADGISKLIDITEFKNTSAEGGKAIYEINVTPNNPGTFRLSIRIYPKHKELAHRQDIALVKWL